MGSISFVSEAYKYNLDKKSKIQNSIAKRNLETDISLLTEEIVENNRDEINKMKSGNVRTSVLQAKISELIDKKNIAYEGMTREEVIKIILDDIFGYSILQEYIEDPEVNDIMVNAYDNIWIRKGLVDYPTNKKFKDEDKYQKFLLKICTFIGQKINGTSPQADGTDERYGLRISISQAPINTYASSLIIRKNHKNVNPEDVISPKMYPEEILQTIDFMQKAGCRVIIAGPLESGKTTFLNTYADGIVGERPVVMEDTPEVFLKNKNTIYKKTVLDKNNVSLRVTLADLVKDFKRTNGTMPIVSEVRGVEAVELLDVFNAGFTKGITSIHANSAKEVIRQLVFQIKSSGKLGTDREEIEEYLSRTLDIIIYMEKRKIVTISEVCFNEEKKEIEIRDLHRLNIEQETKETIEGHYETCINPYSPKMVDRIRRVGLKDKIPENMLPKGA